VEIDPTRRGDRHGLKTGLFQTVASKLPVLWEEPRGRLSRRRGTGVKAPQLPHQQQTSRRGAIISSQAQRHGPGIEQPAPNRGHRALIAKQLREQASAMPWWTTSASPRTTLRWVGRKAAQRPRRGTWRDQHARAVQPRLERGQQALPRRIPPGFSPKPERHRSPASQRPRGHCRQQQQRSCRPSQQGTGCCWQGRTTNAATHADRAAGRSAANCDAVSAR